MAHCGFGISGIKQLTPCPCPLLPGFSFQLPCGSCSSPVFLNLVWSQPTSQACWPCSSDTALQQAQMGLQIQHGGVISKGQFQLHKANLTRCPVWPMERNLDSPQGAQWGTGRWVNSYCVSPMQGPLLSSLNPTLKGLIPSIIKVGNRIFNTAVGCYSVLSQFYPFRVNYLNCCNPFHISVVLWTSDPV